MHKLGAVTYLQHPIRPLAHWFVQPQSFAPLGGQVRKEGRKLAQLNPFSILGYLSAG